MQFKFGVFTVFILSASYFVHLNALDLSSATSLFSQKLLKCHKCSSLLDDDCKDIKNATNKFLLVEECMPGAQGCVKQIVRRFDNKNATFRECYYGSISSLYTSFQCEGIKRDRQYDTVQCFKCRGDLCNNSNRLNSNFGILFSMFLSLAISFILRM